MQTIQQRNVLHGRNRVLVEDSTEPLSEDDVTWFKAVDGLIWPVAIALVLVLCLICASFFYHQV